MAQLQTPNTEGGLHLKEEVETLNRSLNANTNEHDDTFNKHPEEVGEVEISQENMEDAVDGWEGVRQRILFVVEQHHEVL